MPKQRVRTTILLVCLAAWGLGQSITAAPTPAITAVVNRVSAANVTPAVDSVGDFLVRLKTSENAVRGYKTDRSPTSDLAATREFIFNTLGASLGTANVAYQRFTAGGFAGVNIVGTLAGTDPAPAKVYVIGAHYDAEQNPGADDDASGVAGLLEAARVLSQYRFKSTIVFVAFDQEEERRNGWGRGSQYYATTAKTAKANIRAMIGLDMLAYNPADGNKATLSRCDKTSNSASAQLSTRVRTAFTDYSGLVATNQLTGEDASDPYLFYKAGYPALLVSEEFDKDGWPLNPYYHRADDFYLDTQGNPRQYAGHPYIDLVYAAKIMRGVVGWIATEAVYVSAR